MRTSTSVPSALGVWWSSVAMSSGHGGRATAAASSAERARTAGMSVVSSASRSPGIARYTDRWCASRRLTKSTAASAATVAQQPAGCRARALAIAERRLAVDDDLLVATCPLHPPPLSGGEVVDDVADPVRIHVELLHVVDDDIRSRALAQDTPIAESGGMGGQRREAEVRLLQGELGLVPNEPLQQVRRPCTAGEELGVGTAVGYARQRVRHIHQLGHELGVRTPIRAEELGPQVSGDGQVEHHLAGVPVLLACDVGERAPDVLLELWLASDVLHDEVLDRPADAGTQLAVGVLVAHLVRDHRLAQRRVGHLDQLLVVGTRRHRPRSEEHTSE